MLIKACLNGPRRPGDHPALPCTPEDVARDAAAVVAAGAGALHVHPKDAAGADSLHSADVAAVVSAVRAWTVLPDFASVNWHEDGADDVAAALLDRGVQVEAGLWHLEGVTAWQASPYRDRCLRVLLELPDRLDEAAVETESERLLSAVGEGPPVLLHGAGTSCWPALGLALRRGLDTRIGLEDVLHLADGSPAPDNAALVRAATTVLAAVRAADGTDG